MQLKYLDNISLVNGRKRWNILTLRLTKRANLCFTAATLGILTIAFEGHVMDVLLNYG